MKKFYSISQVNCFRSCKQKWAYRYAEKLEARAPQRPLYIGSTIHKLLELRAQGKPWKDYLYGEVLAEYNKMPQTYQEILGVDFIECCEKIMRQYDWAWKDERIKYLATEVKIETKIKGTKYFVGVVDAICELDGDQYIMEHKTFKDRKMSLDQTWLNQQTCLYIKVLNEQGYNIKGVIWDMVKTQAYKPPRVLKDGSFGKQYGEQTLMSFIDYFTEHNVEEDDRIPENVYNDIKDNHLNFLDRYVTPIQPSVIDAVWADFGTTVDEIAKNKVATKNLGKDCDWCEYKELCQAELTGGDVEYQKQILFTTPYQREWLTFDKFMQTPECIACHTMAVMQLGGFPDEYKDKCILNCPKYKKFKEKQG